VNELHSEPYAELHGWLSSQHPGLRTFKILQRKLALLAADHPEQRAMCRLLDGIINSYVEEFDEAPLPTATALSSGVGGGVEVMSTGPQLSGRRPAPTR